MCDQLFAPSPISETTSILPSNKACNGCSTAKVACVKSTGSAEAPCVRCEERDIECVYRPRKRPNLHATIDRLTAEKAELTTRHVQEIAEKDALISCLRAELAQAQSTLRRPGTTVEADDAQHSLAFSAADHYRYWTSGNLTNGRAPSMASGASFAPFLNPYAPFADHGGDEPAANDYHFGGALMSLELDRHVSRHPVAATSDLFDVFDPSQ